MNRLAFIAMLALPVMAQTKQTPAPAAPKPPVVKPLQTPPRPVPVENGDIDKRRDRMKQRDAEVDKILKEKQRKEAERSRR